eukprot:1047049-Pyramimonas_sp.AAC.1
MVENPPAPACRERRVRHLAAPLPLSPGQGLPNPIAMGTRARQHTCGAPRGLQGTPTRPKRSAETVRQNIETPPIKPATVEGVFQTVPEAPVDRPR